jgi:hypothetical protein
MAKFKASRGFARALAQREAEAAAAQQKAPDLAAGGFAWSDEAED